MIKEIASHHKLVKFLSSYFSSLNETRDIFVKRTLKLIASKLQPPPIPDVLPQGLLCDALSSFQEFLEELVESTRGRSLEAAGRVATVTAISEEYEKAEKLLVPTL